MATKREDDHEEAITAEEIAGAAEPEPQPEPQKKRERPKNAFTELMAAKKKKEAPAAHAKGAAFRGIADAGFRRFQSRDALGMYIADPAAFTTGKSGGAVVAGGGSPVVYYTDAFVALRDKFPKSEVHCLLLPRDPATSRQHPVALLSRTDPEGVRIREAIRAEAEKLRRLVAGELRRRFGQFSAADAAREAVLSGESDLGELGELGELPPGRDWAKEVLVGVHSRPSMNHLHVHVLSRDLHSDRLRHRKHYNSFATPFLVRLDEFPLAADDPRQPREVREAQAASKDLDSDDDDGGGGSGSSGHVNYLANSMKCWRCGKDFGNRFQELKRHLDVEFEAWKKE